MTRNLRSLTQVLTKTYIVMIIALIKMVKGTPKHYIFFSFVFVVAGTLSFILPHITSECMVLAGAPIVGEVTRQRLNRNRKRAMKGQRKHHAHVHYEMRQHGKPVNEMHGAE